MPNVIPVVLLAAIVSTSCDSPSREAAAPPTRAVDTARVRVAVAQLFNRLGAAEETGDVAAFGTVFHENARIDGQGGAPLLGRAAIEDKARQSFGARKYHVMDMVPLGTRVWGDTAAHVYGTLVEVHTPHGEKTRTEYGRWASEVARGADGSWRINHLIAFLDSTRNRGAASP